MIVECSIVQSFILLSWKFIQRIFHQLKSIKHFTMMTNKLIIESHIVIQVLFAQIVKLVEVYLFTFLIILDTFEAEGQMKYSLTFVVFVVRTEVDDYLVGFVLVEIAVVELTW